MGLSAIVCEIHDPYTFNTYKIKSIITQRIFSELPTLLTLMIMITNTAQRHCIALGRAVHPILTLVE